MSTTRYFVKAVGEFPVPMWLKRLFGKEELYVDVTDPASVTEENDLMYKVLVSQSGTSAPTVVAIKNNTGKTFTWARTSAGLYTVTASASLPSTAGISVGQAYNGGSANTIVAGKTSSTVFTIKTIVVTFDTDHLVETATDAILSGTLVEIRV